MSLVKLCIAQTKMIKKLKAQIDRLDELYQSAMQQNVKLQKEKIELEDRVIRALRGIYSVDVDTYSIDYPEE